ncbi:MAG: FtsH protease activity modulator HflK [Candidatus Omnitrophota bacterium]|jgi:membrane protease subunit HflK|nr:MAG: FtsH protease activity modulator HflK [Candidatus Omnitrophota bacterium]
MSDWFEDIPIELPKRGDLPMKQIKGAAWIVFVLFLLLVVLSFKPWFTVNPDEVGVVMRLGKYHRMVEPGFHWRLPRPIEIVYTPKVEQVKRIEVGFKTLSPGPPARFQHLPEEGEMLTGDENIVVSELIVQYRISDPIKYLFNVYDVHTALKAVTESVERQIIGDYAIDAALTWGRDEIQEKILAEIQKISDYYEMGVTIRLVQLQDVHAPKPVEPAFLRVTSAREDQSRFVNEAIGYKNGEIPKAEGQAQKILQESEAYRARRIAEAQGEVERFSAVLKEYQSAPVVTRTRLYLETLEKVLVGKPKVILGTDQNLLKFLNVSPLGMEAISPVEPQKPTVGRPSIMPTESRGEVR